MEPESSKSRHGGTKRPEAADVSAEPEALGTIEPCLPFTVVGVGASAGGLEALTVFLRAIPPDTGMAFVLVQHLAPSHDSALAEILSRTTSMPVKEVADGTQVQPNHVYVIPPDANMVLELGRLHLRPREARRHHPIDQFFRSLAANQHHAAIGVILSGTASDGTLGLEELKAEGGIAFAQDDSAQHDGMPRSAVASGCVDFILPPNGIALEIARIASHPLVTPLPGEGVLTQDPAPSKSDLEPVLRRLHAATNVDFTQYKLSTLSRRITRRMVLLKQEGLKDYEALLASSPAEVEALYQDILIHVTSFFRDLDMFESLKTNVIPTLLKDRPRHEPVRVWVMGCSTGEEAYSLAMILSEAMEASSGRAPPQLFATDVNLAVVERARAGVYPKERLQNVSPDRLSRFFVEVDGQFRVTKAIRDVCVFSRHNAMSDPPFSRMDLLFCRNLLMYMDASLQQRIIPILHYALNPTGFLVLGASESVGQYRNMFETVEAKHKIFSKKPGSGQVLLRPLDRETRPPGYRARRFGEREATTPTGIRAGALDLTKEADRLLLEFAPASVLIDWNFEILQFRGNIEPYLAPAQGKASLALLKVARAGLLVPLRVLLQRAKEEVAPVHEEGVRVELEDGSHEINIRVSPLKGPSAPEKGFLVTFEDTAAKVPPTGAKSRSRKVATKADADAAEAYALRLEHELAGTREYLRSLGEQHDAATMELQSVNEQAQSANEELQSINEELETSKEEIQSTNEELTTVNDELSTRNLELGQLNNDLTNLINSVRSAIIIVGPDLRIRRFSPMAERLLNVIATDVGRPITDIRLNVELPELHSLLGEVIRTTTPQEREVQIGNGRWYSLKLRPYVTLEKQIDGAVLTLTDVDVIRNARVYAESIVATVRDPLLILYSDLRVRSANRSFFDNFNVTREDTEGRLLYELGNGQWDRPEVRRLLTGALPGEDITVTHDFESIGRKSMRLNARRLTIPGEDKPSILLAISDVTEPIRLEDELRKHAEDLDAANRSKADFIAVLSHELRTPLNAISCWAEVLRRPEASADDRRRGMEVIVRNSKLQAQLISDLLDVHRIATGKLSLELRTTDVRVEVDAAIDAALPAATQRGIHIAFPGYADPAFVRGDPARLQQVLGNLLSNAIKFSPDGGEIRIELHQEGARIEVSVSDGGQGISREALPRIFEMFRQVESPASRVKGGLGLGLAVSKQLIELHGGTVSARSPGKGKGATFVLSLPLLSEVRPAISARPTPEPSTSRLSGLMVLVVDDEADAREPVRRLLEAHGAEVVSVRSVGEALEAIQQQRPDVLVSDIGMPGRDGYELIRIIRALSPGRGGKIPAIALTAFSAAQDRERALRAGYMDHLVKPVKPSALVAAIAELTMPRPE